MIAAIATCAPAPGAHDPVMIEVEAESAAVIKPPLVVRQARGASGGKVLYADPRLWKRPGKFVMFPRKAGRQAGMGLAEYTIQVPRDGRYRCWFRCWYLHGGDDSFYFRIDEDPWELIAQLKHMDWRWIGARLRP